MTIHSELKALAGDKPAAYISITFFRALLISSLLDSVKHMKNTPISTGQQVLSAVLLDATFSGTLDPLLAKFSNARPDQLGMFFNSSLTVDVQIVVTSNPTKKISTVNVVFENIRVNFSARQNVIFIDNATYTSTQTVTRDADAADTLNEEEIDPLEAARVEGHIAYGVIPSALGRSIGQQKQVSLSSAFPAFDFGSQISLSSIGAGKFVAIVPSDDYKLKNVKCTCGTGPDIGVQPGEATVTNVPANPAVNDEVGSVKIGGPLPENINPANDLGPRRSGDGKVGVYLPKHVQEAMTTHAIPAVLIHAEDHGFIGFDANATVGFSQGAVRLDTSNAGTIVKINLSITMDATCDLDMGKGLRLPIGYAIVKPTSASDAYVEIGFYPVIDGSEIRLKAVLLTVQPGTYVAVVLGIGTALEIIGVTAWVGCLIDVVLSAIVSNNLPSALRRQVKEVMTENEWRLVDAASVLNIINPRNVNEFETHDVDGDTLLASFEYNS